MQSEEQKLPRAFTATLTSPGRKPLFATNLSSPGDSHPESSSLTAKPAQVSPLSELRREGADLLPIPAPTYYSTDQLSRRPQPLAEANLDTAETRSIIISGKMILKLWINDRGAVVDVEVEKTELPETFSRTAIAAFKQLRFAAGERQGQPVGSVLRIEVSYVDSRSPPP